MIILHFLKYKNHIFFKKGHLEYNNIFPSQTFEKYSQLSPVQLFELFFTDDIIDFIIYELTLYSLSKNYNIRKISRNELQCFLIILIIFGYNVLPGRECYWDGNDDMANYMVRNAMRRDRFIEIARIMHCGNNKDMNHDKLFKLRSLMNKFI
jgi:hypothetical protein